MASPFSGSAGRKASQWQALKEQEAETRGLGELDAGATRSLADLGSARRVYSGAQAGELAALRSGYGNARGDLNTATAAFSPYTTAGLAGLSGYQDAIGLNGAAGADRARAAFQASPGYQWQVDQATDAAARKASALGLTASGNTLDAIGRLSSNLANQEWGSHLDRLRGVTDLGYNATGQQAGMYRSLADLDMGYGTGRAGVYQGTADRVGATYGNQAGVNERLGQGRTQLITNTGRPIADIGGRGLMAGQEAAATRLNFGLDVAGKVLDAGKTAMKMFGA